MNQQHSYSLKHLNSLGFQSTVESFVEIDELSSLQRFITEHEKSDQPLLVLGGGSNLILADSIPGTVLKLTNDSVSVVSESADSVVVEVGAGFEWHRFVSWCLSQGYYGLENLALIPGTVGASPIQNIGAYGVELKDVMLSLDAVERKSAAVRTFENSECQFSYRNSCFKHALENQFIIWCVRFRLHKDPSKVNLSYQALKQYLSEEQLESPSAHDVFEAVCTIRREKLPDPNVIGNVGSFFVNPVISADEFASLIEKFPDVASFAAENGARKVAAGWLIDKAGWKGCQKGKVGVYDKQALVLVNHGGGNREALLGLATEIQRSVKEIYNIKLEIEPRCYPTLK